MNSPKAKNIPYALELHGDVRQDGYYWLRHKENPEVIQYLEDENRYYEEVMKPLSQMTERLYEQMLARVPDAEIDVPVQSGDYFYYARTDKNLQYPVYARKQTSRREELLTAKEEIVLDLNDLAIPGGYLSVTLQRMSPAQTRLAYLENRDGTDQFRLFVKDIASEQLLPDSIPNIFIHSSLEWDATGEYVFYIVVDASQRPYQLWRHRLGEPIEQDALIYEEKDNSYSLQLSKARSGKFLFLKSENKSTNETRFLSAETPIEAWQLAASRTLGIKYDMEHFGDDFLFLTNKNAQNFQVLKCSIENFEQTEPVSLFPYDETMYLEDMFPFNNGLILSGRQNGLTEIWVYRNQSLNKLTWNEPLYTVSFGANRSFETSEVLIQYESLLTPKTTIAVDLDSFERTTLQTTEVPGEYDPAKYTQERIWAEASDGTAVPMVAVYRADLPAHGPSPLLLYAYGSYGINSDPHFSPTQLPLLDAGLIMVTAQVRGGSEMGRSWYEDGKFLKKRNTFSDFVAAAEDLIARGYTTPDLLAAYGGSAGGLLVGAVSNLAGHLFKVMVPAVPFVDVVTTMLDATIPLTTLEWDEWGNPADEEYYHYMKSYSPYDNVEAKGYPHMLITTGLNDPRVAYWEPAKWVARLRELKTNDNVLLLKTNMGAGHFGASGRFSRMKEMAGVYAFILDKIGVRVE